MVPTRWATMMTVVLRELRRERGAQPRIGREVERREAVVEDEDAGLAHDRARDGEPLPLAPGDVRAALGDRSVQLAVHGCHEVAALGDVQGTPQLLVRGVLVAVAQVAGHRAAEQERLLGHEADAPPELLPVHLAHIDAVHEDRAAGDVVQPRDEVDERRLAAAGAAHDGGRLARRGPERDAAQHRLLGTRIAEAPRPGTRPCPGSPRRAARSAAPGRGWRAPSRAPPRCVPRRPRRAARG